MDQNGGSEGFRYTAGASNDAVQSMPEPQVQTAATGKNQEIRWQASEFIDHQKSAGWFLLLALGAVVGAALMYLITKSTFSTVIVVLAVLAFGLTARQRPRTLTYVINADSLQIGDRTFRFDDFRTFSILQEGALYSIFLEPIQRFVPPVSIYFDPADGEKIFDLLASHIPHTERKPDAVENLMRRIRF